MSVHLYRYYVFADSFDSTCGRTAEITLDEETALSTIANMLISHEGGAVHAVVSKTAADDSDPARPLKVVASWLWRPSDQQFVQTFDGV